MATQSSFKQQCPSCEAMVPIRDPKLIGRKIDCPKCKYRFVVEEPVDEVEEAEEEEAPAKKGKAAAGITTKKPANGKAVTPALKRRADDDEDQEEDKPKKKKSGGSGMLILGIGLAAVALIALAVGAVFLFSDDKEEKKSSGKPSANVAPQGGADDVKPPDPAKEKSKDELKPRQEDVTNLLPNDTQVVVNLPLEYLLGNGKVNEAFLRTPGAFHEKAFESIWGIRPADLRRVVLAYNVEKKTVFAVMRTSMQMKEKQIVGGLKLKAEAPVGGLTYYLVQKPLDTLSSFLLKGGEYHDKVALHFIDPFTVVCADIGPMNQFLQAKGQPKQLSKQAAEEAADDGAKGGPPAMPGMPGMPGGPGGGRPNGPPPGMQPGRPGGPPAGMRGGPAGMMPPGMGQGGGGGDGSDAAPVSTSYMTVDPHLKAVLDQVEKVDKKENQNVLLSLAVSTSAVSVEEVKKNMAQQGVDMAAIPDVGLKVVLDLVQSKLKAVGVAVTAFGESKVSVNAGAEFADTKLAQEWQQKANDFIPTFLTSSGLDLVPKNAGGNNANNGNNGNNMAGMQGDMQGMQQRMQQQQEMQRRMQQGGMQAPGAGFNGMRPPAGGLPGGQAPDEGEKKEEKGKLGDYLVWTKDNVVALGANLKIPSSQDAEVGKILQYAGVYVRSMTAMSERRSRIHELAMALQAYLDKTGHFPRGAVPRPEDGHHVLGWRPDQRRSWMTQLLPYLANGEFQNLKFEDNKTWYEGFDNQKAGLTVIPQFVAPTPSNNPLSFYVQYPNLHADGPGLWAATHFVGMAGVGLDAAEYRADDAATAKLRGVFGYDRETKKADIKDGLDQTIVLIQVPPEPKAPWIAGGGSTVRGVSEDLECVQPFVSTEHQGKRGTFAIMADGKVRFIPANIDPKTFQALCTIAGGDKIKDIDKIAPEVPPPEDLLNQPELKAEPAAPLAPPPNATPKAGASRPNLPAGWKEIVSKEGRYRVAMPPGQSQESTRKMPSPGGEITLHQHIVALADKTWSYAVLYADVSGNMKDAETELNGFRTGLISTNPGSRTMNEKQITLSGCPGQEFQMIVPGKGNLTIRVYLDKKRFYTLIAGGQPGKAAAKDVQAFFDSFKLTGK